MQNADVAVYIGRWRPSSVSPQAAAFAREVITKTGPAGRERAKNLLRASGKLADYAIGLGPEAVPDGLRHPSVTERFTRCAPGQQDNAQRAARGLPPKSRKRRRKTLTMLAAATGPP
jgi:hypothetical protein